MILHLLLSQYTLGATLLSHLSQHLDTLGQMILNLSPTCLPFCTLVSTCLGLLWIRLAGCFYTCLRLPLCLPAYLDTLGHMALHLSPCLSPFLLHLSPLASDYSGYTWPELACLLLRYFWAGALGRVHLFPLVSLLVSTLGYSRPDDFYTCLPAGLSACLPSCYTCLHLSPCWSPFLFPLSPSWSPACLTSQVHAGLKALNIFSTEESMISHVSVQLSTFSRAYVLFSSELPVLSMS